MITTSQSILAADKAARGAQIALGAKGQWLEGFDLRPEVLAQFVAQNPTAPAEALYRLARTNTVHILDWADIGAPLRVAFEVFRASYLAIAHLIEQPPAPALPPPRPGAFGKRAFDRKAKQSLGARVELGSPASEPVLTLAAAGGQPKRDQDEKRAGAKRAPEAQK